MLSRKRLARSQVILLVFGAFLAACSGGAENTTNDSTYHTDLLLTQPGDIKAAQIQGDGPLQVVATTSIVAAVVANVGGEVIALDTIIPRMTDPHGYQLTPGDLRMLHDADVVFINGLGLEESLEQSLSQLPDEIPIVSLSEGIQLREFTLERTRSAEYKHLDR